MRAEATTRAEGGKDFSSGIPVALNFLIAAAHLVLSLYQFFILPLYLLPLSPWWGLSAPAVAALSNSYWSLIHEAIHDMFHPSRRVNAAAARMLGIFFGSPFRVLRVTHLMHHRLNRSPLEGTELYDAGKTTKFRASLGYYFQIFAGLYLVEVLSALFFLLPRRLLVRLRERAEAKGTLAGMALAVLTQREALAEIRADGVAVLGLFATSVVCYGRHWPWLAGAVALRAILISFLDNVYHYRTPVDDVLYADNLRLPAWLSKSLLYFNLHGVHHRNTAIPWIRLPEVFRTQSLAYDGNYFRVAARQLSGPIPLSEVPRLRR